MKTDSYRIESVLKKAISLAIIVIVIFSPLMVYAESYEFNDGEIAISLDNDDWEVYTKDNYQNYRDEFGDAYEIVEGIFETSEMLAISIEGGFYWTLGFTKDEKYADYNFSAISDDELLSVFGNETDFNDQYSIKQNDIFSANGYKYIVVDAIASSSDYARSMRMYETCVGDTMYIIYAYSTDTDALTDSQIDSLEQIVKTISYVIPPTKESKVESNSNSDSFGKAFLKRALYVIAITAFITVIRVAFGKKKDSNDDVKKALGAIDKQKEDNKNDCVNEDNSDEFFESTPTMKTDSIAEVEIENTDGNELTESQKSTILDSEKDEVVINQNKTILQDNIEKAENIEIPEKQLRQLKELYDSGVLTEEEYSEKKKQLLGL